MSQIVVYNGTTYAIPTNNEIGWGTTVTNFLVDVANSAVTLTGTQTISNKTIRFANGTAGAPSVAFVGDNTTGLFRPAIGQLGLATGGAERARLDVNGVFSLFGDDNTLELAGSATGDPVTITATGADTDVSIQLVPKGAGVVEVDGDVEITGAFEASTLVAVGADNDVTLAGSATTFPVTLTATGSDTDVGIQLASKAAGSLVFKTGSTTQLTISTTALTAALPLAMGTNKITGLGTPTASTDAATKGYVDGLAAGKNRIINGSMNIDQRKEGGSTTLSGSSQYIVDRWSALEGTSATSVTGIRSTTAPAGFANSLLITVGTGASAGAAEQAFIRQIIEGTNCWDLGSGTANAKTITISFWVRSSLTGTYYVALTNSAVNRSYVAAYTIDSANTFEYKTITITLDTTGTWLTTNGAGISCIWDLGSGSNFATTAGAWQAGNFYNASGRANFIGTSSATFYLTGVQFELGSAATAFEWLQATAAMSLCQRYYEKSFLPGVAPAQNAGGGGTMNGVVQVAGVSIQNQAWYMAPKRTSPTLVSYNPSAADANWWDFSSGGSRTASTSAAGNLQSIVVFCASGVSSAGNGVFIHWSADAEF